MRLLNMNKTVAAAALTLICQQTVLADDDFWVGVKAGTLGAGFEATWRPVPYLDIRGGANVFSFDHDGIEAGIEYEGEVDLQTIYATVNLRVPLSPFRVTAGVFSNGNEILLTSRDGGTVTIGGSTYSTSDVGTLQARGDFDGIAPYAGIGFDFRVADTFGVHIDLGVMRQGSANVVFSADGPIANEPAFITALETERQELLSEIEDYELYPVASIGVSFNF